MTRRIVLTACLALLIALTVRHFMPTDRTVTPATLAPDTRFDYTLTDFAARFRDSEGLVELEVSGPRLEHVADTRIGVISEPRFHIEPHGANWRGHAARGRILREDEELVLEDGVELVHEYDDGEVTIVAESLHYHRLRRTIRSEQPVEVRQPDGKLQAGAMNIRLEDNLIEFSNHVQGEIRSAVLDGDDAVPVGDDAGDG